MIEKIKRYQKQLLLLLVPIAIVMIYANIFLYNRYEISNVATDSVLSSPTTELSQTIFMYPDRTLKYIHLYSEGNESINIFATVSQGENIATFTNIAEYKYKDGSFRLPINFKVSSTNDLTIDLKGDNLDKILLSDNTLLGHLTSTPTQNLKISMTFWNDISSEQKTMLWASFVLLSLFYIIFVWVIKEKYFYLAFALLYTFLVAKNTDYIVPIAETISNFAYYAYHSSVSTAFRMSDAGYYPLIPRVITFLLINIFNTHELFVVWTYIFSFSFGAFCTSIFALKPFRTIIPSDFLRVILVILLGMLVHSDSYFIFNTAYWGTSVLVLAPLLNKKQIPLWLYILLTLLVSSLFMSKLLFLTIAPIYGVMFLYYLYQFCKNKERNLKELIFYGIATLGALGQSVYYLFLSNYNAHLNSINIYFIKYLIPNVVRFGLAPLKMRVVDFKSMCMGAFLLGIISISMYRIKNKWSITKKIWYPAFGTFLLYVIFVSLLYSVRRGNQIYESYSRHTIIPLILMFFTYTIFFYQKFNFGKIWKNNYAKCIGVLFIVFLSAYQLKNVNYTQSVVSYAKYKDIINTDTPYVVLRLSMNENWNSLRYKTIYATTKNNIITNLEQINAMFINNKLLNEQLTIKGYDEQNKVILTLPEYFPDYKTFAYFRFGSNTNQYAEIKIFNQNGIDRTKDLQIGIYTNTTQ